MWEWLMNLLTQGGGQAAMGAGPSAMEMPAAEAVSPGGMSPQQFSGIPGAMGGQATMPMASSDTDPLNEFLKAQRQAALVQMEMKGLESAAAPRPLGQLAPLASPHGGQIPGDPMGPFLQALMNFYRQRGQLGGTP